MEYLKRWVYPPWSVTLDCFLCAVYQQHVLVVGYSCLCCCSRSRMTNLFPTTLYIRSKACLQQQQFDNGLHETTTDSLLWANCFVWCNVLGWSLRGHEPQRVFNTDHKIFRAWYIGFKMLTKVTFYPKRERGKNAVPIKSVI